MNSSGRFALRAGSTLVLCVVLFPTSRAAFETSGQPAQIETNLPAAQASAPDGTFVHKSKPYVLFMGADVDVEKDKAFDSVNEVTANGILIKVAGKTVDIPLGDTVSLQVRYNLKISAPGIGISDLKTERTYSRKADPFRQLEAYNSIASGAIGAEDQARGVLLKAEVNYGVNPPPGPSQAAEIAELAADRAAVDTASAETERIGEMLPGADARVEGMQDPTYDAIRVSFAVTSNRNLSKPYCAVVAQIKEPGSKPGQVKAWIHLESLGTLAAGATRKVNIYQEGLPDHYILDKCEVHIYDGLDELATNLSSMRVQLTKGEMLDFRVIEYIAANTGRTLPAVPATFAGDMRPALSPAQLNQSCYVLVAKDGRVAAAFDDKEQTQPLQDPELDAALKGLRFKPAIEEGMPVESVVPIRLGMIVAP